MSRRRTIVVGGGIAGLAAAYFLGDDPTQDVLLLEGSSQVGGKLRRSRGCRPDSRRRRRGDAQPAPRGS